MAHHEGEATPIEHVLEVLNEHGLEGMAEAIQTLMNAAMKLERSEFLRAAPGERSDERIGHANCNVGLNVGQCRDRYVFNVRTVEQTFTGVRIKQRYYDLHTVSASLDNAVDNERSIELLWIVRASVSGAV